MLRRIVSRKFLPWIVIFFILLGSIPVLIIFSFITLAKVIGVATVLITVIALRVWLQRSREINERQERIKLTTNDLFWLNKHIPFYSKLSKKDKRIFEDRIGIFLAEITITEINKDTPDKETCFYVASSAVIAYWGLPFWNYGSLSEVLVYPTNFDLDNRLNKLGVVQGKVHHGGLMNNTMILSLPALIAGFQISNDKKNVGVHEFSHLLDKSDGEIDGLPEFLGEEDRKIWIGIFESEIKKMSFEKSSFPLNASRSNAEFFASAVEYFKECPNLLKRKHPELYNVLNSYFNSVGDVDHPQ